MHRIFIYSLLAFLLLLAGGFLIMVHLPSSSATSTQVTISRGMSFSRIGALLEEEGIVSSRLVFTFAATLSGKSDRLQSGTYLFPPRLSIQETIDILSRGSHQVDLLVTIPEGTTVRGIASILKRRAGLDSVKIMTLSEDRRFIDSMNIAARSLEGYLMPDTYRLRPEDSEQKVLGQMIRQLQGTIRKADRTRLKQMKRTLHEVLTMASLVEGETRLNEERTRVAGVYYNRLRRGMLLQADPTIQYLISDGPRRLLYRDLDIDSPYNTYKYPGLPPGPVNNPGRASIRAALYPESHGFLYFVADGKGGHRFSRTASEHQTAVSEYRQTQRNTLH